jgi:dipeptidyl aminopeptidase/acylaminoacyl peptidase
VSPDGTTVAFIEERPETAWDILLLDPRSRRVTRFTDSRSNETYPCFSPDGRWIAYVSDETGRGEVYVQASSGRGGKVQISSGGGREPLWSRDGKRLFYLWEDQVWAVDVRIDPEFAAGRPRLLFEKPGYAHHNYIRGWDISTDSQRFLMVKREDRESEPVTELVLVQHWLEELKRLVPMK